MPFNVLVRCRYLHNLLFDSSCQGFLSKIQSKNIKKCSFQRPILAVSDGEFKKYLEKNVPTLENKFWPTFWCFESRAQTILASIFRGKVLPIIDYDREVLTLGDGGEVALDWFAFGCEENSPVIIILPGLAGASQAEYIKCLVIAANNCRMRTVVFNNRGLGGLELKTPRLYCAANSDDLFEVVKHVAEKYPTVKLGATGVSMGGLVLSNYMISHPEEARKYLTAAKMISVPWNTHKASENTAKPWLNYLLGRHLVGTLCSTLKNCHVIRNTDIDIDNVVAKVSFLQIFRASSFFLTSGQDNKRV